MNFKLIFRRECWNLWNFIKFRLIFLVIVLVVLISVLCVNSETNSVFEVFYKLLQVHNYGDNPLFANIKWFTIQLLPLLLIGSYVYDDLFLSGPFILLRIKSQTLLWLSKILILLVMTLLYYVLIFILVQIIAYFFGFSILPDSSFGLTNISTVFLAFVVGSFTLLILQSVLSMFFTPIIAIVASIVLLVFNIYSQQFIIPGNISDVLAYTIFNGEQPFVLGILVQLLWITLASFVGRFYYKHVDLLYRN